MTSLRFKQPHPLLQPAIVFECIRARMSAPMTVRAQGNHELGIIRPAVTQAANMMRFEIGLTISTMERRGIAAALADTLGPSDYIVADVAAALKNRALRLTACWRRVGRAHRSGPEFSERKRVGNAGIHDLNDILNRTKFENDRGPDRPCSIWRSLCVVSLTDELASKLKAVSLLLEHQQITAVRDVTLYRAIAAHERHVANLALAEIFKDAVGPSAVSVSVRHPLLSGDDDDRGVAAWRDDAALPLTIEAVMNVATPVVGATALEIPGHVSPDAVSCTVRDDRTHVEHQLWGVVSNFRVIAGTGAGSTAQETPEITFSEKANF